MAMKRPAAAASPVEGLAITIAMKRPAPAASPVEALASKIGAPEGSKAFQAVVAKANGSTISADSQGAMSYMKTLSSSGRPFVLEQYKECKGNIAMINLSKALSLDPVGSFCEATEHK